MYYPFSAYSFSGPDCSGKSTQINLLFNHLSSQNKRPVILWTRLGYTPGFVLLKVILRKFVRHNISSSFDSRVSRDQLMSRSIIRLIWLFVALCDLFFTLSIRSRVILFKGHSLILDRWFWDSLIDYRLYHNGPTWLEPFLIFIYSAFCLKPSSQFLLDIPYSVALDRSLTKNEPFADSNYVRFMRHELYDKLPLKSNFSVCNAMLPIDKIYAFVLKSI